MNINEVKAVLKKSIIITFFYQGFNGKFLWIILNEF